MTGINAIAIQNVDKSYDGKIYAVKDLNLEVPAGSVFGFLGPNGAGKTTTVKMLSGLLKPTAGEMMVNGFDPAVRPEKVHEVSALMTETTMMYDHLTAEENMAFFGRLYDMTGDAIRARAKSLIERVGLSDAKGKLKTFSTGMRQRLSLARVLLHEPILLFLDEPTSGLDPESVQWVNNIIAEQGNAGATVFLCTHQLRYAEEICTHYGLMDRGRLLASGTFQQLMTLAGSVRRLQIRAAQMPEGMMVPAGDGLYECAAADDAAAARLIEAAVRGGALIYEAKSVTDSLEDLYFKLLDAHKGGDKHAQ